MLDNSMPVTGKRKGEHVRIALEEDIQAKKNAGFDDVELVYSAMPELNFEEIDTSCKAFGKDVSSPIYVEGMTGGFDDAKKINREIAAAAEKAKIPFSVGSMRAMIEKPELKETYYVRDIAKTVPILGNIGVVQLKEPGFVKKLVDALNELEVDALSIHTNPLQELVQPEGDRDFTGCYEAIKIARDSIKIPIIVKEVGAGINGSVAKKLEESGVDYVNIGGLGGTSWTAIELFRSRAENKLSVFRDIGVPTVVALVDVKRNLTKAKVIASGGLRSGLDAAKCIALGAEHASAALPFLKAWKENRITDELSLWKEELKAALYATGSENLEEFKKKKPIILGRTAEYIRALKEASQ